MESNSGPIILYFHQGFSPYLPFALEQARISNPRARLVLLGDRTNLIRGIDYEHHCCPEDSDRRRRFHRAFVHLNTSNLEDERRCIERWLCLADFLETVPPGPFWFLDSDAFPLCNLGQLARDLGGELAGLPHLYGTCYCPEAGVVRRLADWILEQYENPERLHFWTNRFEKFRRGQPGGLVVHDMALITEFESEQGLRLRDLREPCGRWLVDGGAGGGAFLQKKKNAPKIWRSAPDRQIRVRCPAGEFQLAILHLQGNDKSHAAGVTGWRPALALAFFRPSLRRNLKYLCKYFYHGARYHRYLETPPA